ncbi:hypothetical protein [Corallincola spongiicola]|uniref:Uncharacterized protein n=1 Tax=Corallincola spongiicola TaxID=2520508 RepID=A0ABY1WSX7_9GAMM|nr:hypothetical protein [Corallincola spongiicola]TAA47830.1 hypothetical protein EXY25_00845 [Corallincola spongiicola]
MKKLVVGLLVSVLVACASNTLPPRNITKNLHTLGGGFVFSSKGGIYYAMTYVAGSELNTPVYVIATFENPADKAAPLVIDLGIIDFATQQQLKSPEFSAIENDRNYQVTVDLHQSAAQSELIESHSDEVRFSINEEMAKQFGLTLL